MFTLNSVLADGIIIQLGGQVWFFSANVLVFLLGLSLVGLIGELVLLQLLIRRFLPLLLCQGQPAPDVSLARSTALEQGKTLPDTSTLGLSPRPSRL